MSENKIIWKDRKRTVFGLPLSFTVYIMTDEKLLINTGFLNRHQEEIMLYKISDLTLDRTLGQRLFGIGTIHCNSSDKTTPKFDIKNIKNSEVIKEELSKAVYKQKDLRRVSAREIFTDDDDL